MTMYMLLLLTCALLICPAKTRHPYPIFNPCDDRRPVRLVIMSDGSDQMRNVDILRLGRFLGKVVESLPSASAIAFIQNGKPAPTLNLTQYATIKDDRLRYVGWISNPHKNRGRDLTNGVSRLVSNGARKVSKSSNDQSLPLFGIAITNGYSKSSLRVFTSIIKRYDGQMILIGLPPFDVPSQLAKYSTNKPSYVKAISSYYKLDNYYVDLVLNLLCQQSAKEEKPVVKKIQQEVSASSNQTRSVRPATRILNDQTKASQSKTVPGRSELSIAGVGLALKQTNIGMNQVYTFMKETNMSVPAAVKLLQDIHTPAQLVVLLNELKPLLPSNEEAVQFIASNKATMDFMQTQALVAKILTNPGSMQSLVQKGDNAKRPQVNRRGRNKNNSPPKTNIPSRTKSKSQERRRLDEVSPFRNRNVSNRGRKAESPDLNSATLKLLPYNKDSCLPDNCRRVFGSSSTCIASPSSPKSFYCSCQSGYVFDRPDNAKSCVKHGSSELQYSLQQWRTSSVSLRLCNLNSNSTLTCDNLMRKSL